MKKINNLPLLLLFALSALLAICALFAGGCAEQNKIPTIDPRYKFEVAKYGVTFDISSNGSMKVSEDITVNYQGPFSTGFIRDIPVNGGAKVKNVKVNKYDGNRLSAVWYDVRVDDANFISVDIGDGTRKYGKSERYLLTYTYAISNSVLNSGRLPLNPVGTGWGCTLYDVGVKLILPDGYTSAKCYGGLYGSTASFPFAETVESGRTVLTAYANSLDAGHGISFDITFEKGKITSYFDFTPYIFALIGAVLIAAAILIKIFVVNKNRPVPVVNYTAPNGMDPMKMGKLIDNAVNNEDVTSMIYYWASKGYVKINLDDKRNPVIIRTVKNLPDGSPDYEVTLFRGMFVYGDAVTAGTLENKYYVTVRSATAQLNAKTKGLYVKKSLISSAAIAVLAALILGIAPLILGIAQISLDFLYFLPMAVAFIPSFIIYFLSSYLVCNKLKLGKAKFIGFTFLTCFIGLTGCAVYAFLVCHGVLGVAEKIVLCAVCFTAVGCAPLALNRSKAYTRKLNDILGFKNFIALAEKKELEAMLEQDPQYYYEILPYAQVLGVSDKWEEKFASITVEPPQWLAGNLAHTVIQFHILNSIIKSSAGSMSSHMHSRPAQSGSNGRGFGGGFGGSSGGGFGGGGGRGR